MLGALQPLARLIGGASWSAAICSSSGRLLSADSTAPPPAGAAAAAAWSAGSRALSSDASSPPPPASEPSDEEKAASLPFSEQAKALLAGNCRAQLTTVAAGEPGPEENKVTSSVAAYLSPRGEAPVVLLSGASDASHLANLGESRKASLATGHCGPAWFVQRLRATGWLPRRVALLGSLEPLPAGEVKFALDQARKAYGGAPALAAQLPGDDALPGLQGFRLQDITQAVYVDAAGRQHPVDPQHLDSCFLDPLAVPQHDLLAELNQAEQWQAQLQLFCAAYLGVHAREVLLAEADRLGFTLLGAPTAVATADAAAGAQQAEQRAEQQAQQAQQRWRQFRIGSSREIRSKQAFVELLEQMRAEVAAAAGAA